MISRPENSPGHPAAKRGVLLLLTAAVLFAGCRAQPASTAPEPGSSASGLPPISTIDAAGLQKLLQQSQADILVVNLWATWCPPCVAEMPVFAELYRRYPRNQIDLLAVSADDPATIDTRVRPFQKEKNLPFPIYVLQERDPSALDKALGVELSGALPTTMIFDRSRTLQHQETGETTLDALIAAIEPLLKR